MVARPSIVAVLVGALASLGASFRTPNFIVDAPTPQIAQQVGQYAEHYRREKAIQWLGQEMPQWGVPCPLRVKVSMNGSGGATTFAFDNGRILDMHMNIEGTVERMLSSVLPHEVTHTVFAYAFRCPVPRWADEGGAVLSEDDIERNRHDQLVRQILNGGRAIPLRRLLALKEYPPDVMVLYAEGYSVTSFLVGKSDRATFLRFVNQGMSAGWDEAVRNHYRFRNVEELEGAWLQHLRETRGQPVQLASRNQPEQTGQPSPGAAPQVVVRQTVPPAQPLSDSQPIIRAQAPETEDSRQPMATPVAWDQQPRSAAPAAPAPSAPPATNWQMQTQPNYIPPPPPVYLGPPRIETVPPVQLGRSFGGRWKVTTMADFDDAERHALHEVEPADQLRWLLEGADEDLTFYTWLPTQMSPPPGVPQLRCDRVAGLRSRGGSQPPWACLIEAQGQPLPGMAVWMLIYLGLLHNLLRFNGRDPFQMMGVILNLSEGQLSHTIDWRVPLKQTSAAPATEPDASQPAPVPPPVPGVSCNFIIKNVRQESAAKTLERIDRGELGLCILVWVPLMVGADQAEIIRRWRELALHQEQLHLRADYAALALVFAEMAGRKPLWQTELEGFNVASQ